MRLLSLSAISLTVALLTSCGGTGSFHNFGPPNMPGPTVEARKAAISAEPSGNYFIGRRYFVKKTRFWGYLRKPGQSATSSKLVIFNEKQKLTPDRFSETGPPGKRYGFDNNYEYRIEGYYNGQSAYDPNSNQVLPEFVLTSYQVLDRNPGWLFSPKDHYDPYRLTLQP